MCEVILQKVEMYKEKKMLRSAKKNHPKKRFEEGSKSKSFVWQEMILDLITLKHDIWAYLSFSCINPNLAYITYFESPFGSNAGTWAKECSSLGK